MLQGWCAVQHAPRTSEELPHWVTAGDDGNSCVTTCASISDVGGQRDAVLPVETCAPCGPVCAPPDREGGASAAGGARGSGRCRGELMVPCRTMMCDSGKSRARDIFPIFTNKRNDTGKTSIPRDPGYHTVYRIRRGCVSNCVASPSTFSMCSRPLCRNGKHSQRQLDFRYTPCLEVLRDTVANSGYLMISPSDKHKGKFLYNSARHRPIDSAILLGNCYIIHNWGGLHRGEIVRGVTSLNRPSRQRASRQRRRSGRHRR